MPPYGDEVRARLLDHVRRDPGIVVADAAQLLGLCPSTVSYHVRVLARRQRIVPIHVGRNVALFVAGEGSCPWMRGLIPHLRDPVVQAAAAQLLQGPVQVGQVARAHGLPRHRASGVLRRLERAGACDRTRAGLGRAPPERIACLERAVLRQRCSKQGACGPRVEREAAPAAAERGTRSAVVEAERAPAAAERGTRSAVVEAERAPAARSYPRQLTLNPSPSGRMSVSTPGVPEARRL